MTRLGKGRVPAGVNKKLLEKSAAAGMKLIGNPAKLVLPTSVGFATSAHAKCAFIVAPKDFAGLTAVAPGGHPADGSYRRSTV